MAGLSAKDKLFVVEYLKDLNATQAAIRAGFAESTALGKAPGWVGKSRENSKKPLVWDAIQIEKESRIERTKIDADWVLLRLGEMIDADPCDIIDENTGAYKPIHDWPVVWRRMLSAADVKEVFEGYGEDREKIGEIVKYKFIDKLKAYEMVGKHVDVQAFKDKIEVEENTTLAEKLKAARARSNR